MKKLFSILTIIASVFACTPNLEPEFIPESGNESESEEPAAIPVQSIEVNTLSLSLEPGAKATLTATVTPDNATNKTLVWTTSDYVVATVSQNGEVTALSEGECTVTVSCDGKKAECTVTVAIQLVPVSSVSLSSTSENLLVGETIQLTATVLPENATDQTVIWTSSDENVAIVDGGKVTAISEGETTITATAGEYSATCLVTVSVPFSYDGICLESIGNGTVRISNQNQFTIDYKVEDEEWTSVNGASIFIETKAGQRVWFRGLNETYSKINPNDNKNYIETTISCQGGDYYLYGNLMSLIYGDDFECKTELTGEHAFFRLFYGNTHLVNHPTKDILLPATTLSSSCYRNLFYGCTKLTRAPELPARVLSEWCYASMFACCSSLKEFPKWAAEEMAPNACTWMMMRTGLEVAPELPAKKLALACYEFMFSECPNLKKGPSILPATELASSCYTGMFQGCEALTEAPELPATNLVYDCYSHMFNRCKSLTKAPKLPATKMANNCYCRMFGNSGLVEAPELPAMELEVWCYYNMFQNCTSLVKAPDLPATTLYLWCYENMFDGCSSLNYIKVMASKRIQETDTSYKVVDLKSSELATYCKNWVNGVAASGTFVTNPEMIWDIVGPNGVPEGWTIQ